MGWGEVVKWVNNKIVFLDQNHEKTTQIELIGQDQTVFTGESQLNYSV